MRLFRGLPDEPSQPDSLPILLSWPQSLTGPPTSRRRRPGNVAHPKMCRPSRPFLLFFPVGPAQARWPTAALALSARRYSRLFGRQPGFGPLPRSSFYAFLPAAHPVPLPSGGISNQGPHLVPRSSFLPLFLLSCPGRAKNGLASSCCARSSTSVGWTRPVSRLPLCCGSHP